MGNASVFCILYWYFECLQFFCDTVKLESSYSSYQIKHFHKLRKFGARSNFPNECGQTKLFSLRWTDQICSVFFLRAHRMSISHKTARPFSCNVNFRSRTPARCACRVTHPLSWNSGTPLTRSAQFRSSPTKLHEEQSLRAPRSTGGYARSRSTGSPLLRVARKTSAPHEPFESKSTS